MSASDDHLGPGKQRAFSPYLAPNERKQLQEALNLGADLPPGFAEELRALARRYIDDGDSLKLRAICLLVADLCEQGWDVSVEHDRITFEPPGIGRSGRETVEDVKARVRAALQAARRRQLEEPSVRKFLARMERRTLRGATRTSVLDLIDDGTQLAAALRKIGDLGSEERDEALAKLVEPVLEICEAGAKCTDTGLALIDIWRYFRHTWAHEYRAVPGRQMLVLIRNAARPHRPVMGIAMLSSPVMRLRTRDQWIGWLREPARERLLDGRWDAKKFARCLRKRIDTSISFVRWDDLLTEEELVSPTEAVILRLEQRAAGAAVAREKQLRKHFEKHAKDGRVPPHRGSIKAAHRDADWQGASNDLLFVRKRAESLAELLFARRVFNEAELTKRPAETLERLFDSKDGQRAIDIALAEFRKAGLSSEVADVSVCGAVHPYNELLGGKLVALMLTSREMRKAYTKRYGGQTSVIASQMAGRPVTKPTTLRVLTTTSLYGVGSSQYNRLVLRAAEFPNLGHDIKWSAIGRSLTGGFGTLHLGGETARALRSMAIARHDSRRVNNRFGEGTSPRLRQIREGLDALGLKSDAILHHATPRIFYGCELAPGALDALVGLGKAGRDAPGIAEIAKAWRQRWVSTRTLRKETLEKLATLGSTSVLASLHADASGQFSLPFDAE